MQRENMKLAGKKRQLLMPWIGSLALIVFFIVICAALCPSDSYGPEFPVNADCTFTSHVFVQVGIGLSALYILSLLGLFLIVNRSIILDGFYMSPFKPPRFHA
jgi:hypothetical protein